MERGWQDGWKEEEQKVTTVECSVWLCLVLNLVVVLVQNNSRRTGRGRGDYSSLGLIKSLE